MKLNGSHKFKANSWQVFNAILNPAVLQSCIPGCKSVEYVDPTNLRASITTPLPGLKGPYRAVINISQRQEPNVLVLHVKRQRSEERRVGKECRSGRRPHHQKKKRRESGDGGG